MISEFRSIYFRHILDADGTINAESFFIARSDAATGGEARKDALAWAGETGKKMKVPGNGQNSFAEHPELILDAVELKETDNEFIFEIKLSGTPAQNTWTLLPGSETTEKNGETIHKCTYSFRGETPPSAPHPRELISDTDGTIFLCTSSTLKDCGNQHFTLSLTCKSCGSKDLPGNVIKWEDFFKNNIFYRKATFFWDNETYNRKIAELRFFDPAYTLEWADENYVLEKMETADSDKFGRIIELTALKIENKLISLEQYGDENGQEAKAVYFIRKNDYSSFKNLIGTQPSFISGSFVITSVNIKDINPAAGEITIHAQQTGNNIRLDNVKATADKSGINFKETEFFTADADSFRGSLQLYSPAEWAGKNYYLEAFEEKKTNAGSIFKLKAREIHTRMLSMSQKEKFNGFAISGNCCREVIYQSIWQAHADNINDFKELTGTSASWCNDDNIITEVIPEKISPVEYRIKIEAQRRSNPALHDFYDNDNYEFLGNRVDIDCELVDYRFSARECGYYLHSSGLYDLLPEWDPMQECPLITDTALPLRFANTTQKILRISETIYKRGSMTRNINDMIEWGQNRIFNGSVGDFRGSYLKNDLFAKETYDNHGVQWSKITRVYDLAPANTQWNPYYFKEFDI